MSARETFAARFGEDQAAAIEAAAKGHFYGDMFGTHADDNLGRDEFRYWFLLAIGWQCVTEYRSEHGITASVEELRDWAKNEGQLAEHDGDIPDYLAAMVGAYNDWLPAEAAS